MVTRVEYSDGKGSKVCPIAVVKFDNEVFCIASQYETKSDYIEGEYLEIIDWFKAGLLPFLDWYSIENHAFNIKVIGMLSVKDTAWLKEFIKDKMKIKGK